ncbi:MAG: CHAT domain-containing protein [Cyanobacteria bacterium J06621_8]
MNSWGRFIITFVLSLSLILGLNLKVAAQINPTKLVYQAQLQYNQGKAAAAIKLLEQAQSIYQSQNQLLPQAQILALISLAQQQQASWQQARRSLDESLTLIETIATSRGKTQALAQIWQIQGQYHLATERYHRALQDWRKSEKLYRQLEYDPGIWGSILAQARGMTQMGFNRRSCNRILEAFEEPEYRCLDLTEKQLNSLMNRAQASGSVQQIEALNIMGNNLLSMARLEPSQELIQGSYNLSSSLPKLSAASHATMLLSMANLNRMLAFQAQRLENEAAFEQRFQGAMGYYQELISQKATPQNYSVQLMARLNQLSLLIETEHWSQATTVASKIQLKPTSANPYVPLKFAASIQKLKEHQMPVKYSWSELATFYRYAIAQGQRAKNPRLESYGWGYLGELALLHNLTMEQTPELLLQKALVLAQGAKAPEMAYVWQWRLGQIYRQQQQKQSAIASYQAALNNLDHLRSNLALLGKEVKYNFRDRIEPVYREFADLLLVESANDKELEIASNVIEALQVAELDNFFQDACTTYKQKNIEQVDPNAAVIYTVVLPDSLEVVLSAKDPRSGLIFKHHTQRIPQAELEETVKHLRRYIAEPDQTLKTKELAAEVYDWIVRPLRAELDRLHPQTVVFVLDGILQTIPMNALYDGQHYLIQDYAIALTLGLRLLRPEEYSSPTSLLGGGISKFLKIEEREFSALNKVPEELNALGQHNAPVLLNESFTPDNLLEYLNLTAATRVHLATHGQFRPKREQTFLLMWQKLLDIDEFAILLQSRLNALTTQIDLLILSACDTAIGDRRAALGIAGIAVRSGALSTVATLWQVNDDSTAQLMEYFYEELEGHTKAEALRRAQLRLWEAKGRDWGVPAFWSPYVVIGVWK